MSGIDASDVLLANFAKDFMPRPVGVDHEHIPHAPPGDEFQSWKKCSELTEKYDKDMCEAYREQVDTLLVFAGLFSAVVTAFTVESYQWLRTDSLDASVLLLAQIVDLLSPNQTISRPPPSTSAISDAAATRINIFWFLSLSLSLSAALLCILVKQWIREYDRPAGKRHPDTIAIRQMKYQGLEAWRVDDIVLSIPLVLESALALFFIGVLDLLWRLNRRVAIPLTCVASFVALFYILTTFLPALQLIYWYLTPHSDAAQCPYKSPQAWLVFRPVNAILTLFPVRKEFADPVPGMEVFLPDISVPSLQRATSWTSFDADWTALSDTEVSPRPQYRYKALAWIRKHMDHRELRDWIWHCIRPDNRCEYASMRVSSNISCVLDYQAPVSVSFPPFASDFAERFVKPGILFLAYEAETGASENVFVELLYRVFCMMSNRGPEFDMWLRSRIAWLDESLEDKVAVRLDIYAAERLFEMVHDMSLRCGRTTWFGETLNHAAFIIRSPNRSDQRDMLHLGICALLRHWITATVIDGSRLNIQHIKTAINVLEEVSWWLLGYTRADRTYNQTVLNLQIVRELATAIDNLRSDPRSAGLEEELWSHTGTRWPHAVIRNLFDNDVEHWCWS